MQGVRVEASDRDRREGFAGSSGREGRRPADSEPCRKRLSLRQLPIDFRRRSLAQRTFSVEAGDRLADLAQQGVADPAGVFGPLTRIQQMDRVPELVLPAGGECEAQAPFLVGADERQPREDDPHLARADVVPDERGER